MGLSLLIAVFPAGGEGLDNGRVFADALQRARRRIPKGRPAILSTSPQHADTFGHTLPVALQCRVSQVLPDALRRLGDIRKALGLDERLQRRLIGLDLERLKEIHVGRTVRPHHRGARSAQTAPAIRPLEEPDEFTCPIEAITRSLGGRFRQHILDRPWQPWAESFQRRQLRRHVLRKNSLWCAAGERRTPGQHFVHHHTQAVHVRPPVYALLAGCLLG